MNAATEFNQVAQSIEANPLGRLMYGQRELFHSNLLAWFFDTLPHAADRVFRPWTQAGDGSFRRVERERNNLDLVMRWPDAVPLVIENKVFSVPTEEQLTKYSAKVAKWNPQPSKVLLSPHSPDLDLQDWKHVDFLTLANGIADALPKDDSSYEVETLRRYSALVGDLNAFLCALAVNSDDEPVWVEESLLDAISSTQTRAALQKARASLVARHINKCIPGLEQPAGSGMTRGTALVESLEYVYTGGIHVHLGWQLQGLQFRRAAVYHDDKIKGQDNAKKAKREAISREHPEFFSFPPPLPQDRHSKREFNHFAPDFVYQYVKPEGLTVGGLVSIARSIHASNIALRSAGEAAPARPPGARRVAP